MAPAVICTSCPQNVVVTGTWTPRSRSSTPWGIDRRLAPQCAKSKSLQIQILMVCNPRLFQKSANGSCNPLSARIPIRIGDQFTRRTHSCRADATSVATVRSQAIAWVGSGPGDGACTANDGFDRTFHDTDSRVVSRSAVPPIGSIERSIVWCESAVCHAYAASVGGPRKWPPTIINTIQLGLRRPS